MAHSCPRCGLNCNCGGDFDICKFEGTPYEEERERLCTHCQENNEDPEDSQSCTEEYDEQ